MKLAEALLEKKALTSRIAELNGRLLSASTREVDEDAEPEMAQPRDLLDALQKAFDEWESLTVRINRTNNTVKVGDITMMQAIAKRDILKSKMAHYAGLVDHVQNRNRNRRMYGEATPKLVLAEGVSVAQYSKLRDDVGQEFRLLDVAIQAANWANDLVD